MSKTRHNLAITAFILLTSACGDDSDSNQVVVPEQKNEVSSVYELGACSKQNASDTIFVVSENVYYYCNGSDWEMLTDWQDESDSNNTEKQDVLSSGQQEPKSSETISSSSSEMTTYSCSAEPQSSNTSIQSSTSKEESSSSSVDEIDSSESTSANSNIIKNKSVSGVVQFGPFLEDAKIGVAEIFGNNSYSASLPGNRGKLSGNNGEYTLSKISLKSQYARFKVRGLYYNYVTWENSTDSIDLYAVTDLSSRNRVNINILTDLERAYIVDLMDSGYDISSAKKQIERRIFESFFIDPTDFGYAEDLDMFGNDDASGALLAITILFLGNEGDFLWNNPKKMAGIADWALDAEINGRLKTIRKGLESRYASATIPNFEKYIHQLWANYLLGPCDNDSIPLGYIKQVTNSDSKYYVSNYADSTNKNRFVCSNGFEVPTWFVASDIDKDTRDWGKEFNEGDVRNGQINSNLTYVFRDGDWRLGTELDSLLAKAGGKGCVVLDDTSDVKYNDVYYVCKKTSGWVVAPDIYNDTYEYRSECKTTGEGNGSFFSGRVNINNIYVCDNGNFRIADSTEVYWNKACLNSMRDTSIVFENQLSYYKCTDNKWVFNVELNSGIVKDNAGTEYKTITIGNQIWMAQNLNYKSDFYYSYSPDYKNGGQLYNWAAAYDSLKKESSSRLICNESGEKCVFRGLCPEGWHLPNVSEVKTLFSVTGQSGTALNAYGFSVIYTGYYRRETTVKYVYKGTYAYFWANGCEKCYSSAFWRVSSLGVKTDFTWDDVMDDFPQMIDYLSIRCIKDEK